MKFDHVLAVVPVTDLHKSNQFYEALFGRRADNNDERAGAGLSNFAVDDLDGSIAELQQRGLTAGDVVDANKGVRLSTLTDPDGNTIRLVGGFRVDY